MHELVVVLHFGGVFCMPVINTDEKVHIGGTLVRGYEWKSSYIPCSHLRVLRAGRFVTECVHACWTTSGEIRRSWTTSREVRRIGPRAGRFVEAYDILKTMVKYGHNILGCANLI